MPKPLCGSQETGKFFKRWEYQTTLPASWEICMQVKKQQLELDMKQQTGYDNLDSISKSRDITLLTKVRPIKAIVFPVVMYQCENWTIKRAEHQRTDTFELWCWRRSLRVPWTARRPNQSILKEINPVYSLEGLVPKLQYFGHLMYRANSLEKALMLGKIEGRRRKERWGWEGWWHHQLGGYEFEQTLGDGGGQGSLACCSPCDSKELDTTEWLNCIEVSNTLIPLKSPVLQYLSTLHKGYTHSLLI